MTMFVTLFCYLLLFISVVVGQHSINAAEGFNAPLQCFLALLVCYGLLGGFALAVNIIKYKCVKTMPVSYIK